jgi:hypothetical protein
MNNGIVIGVAFLLFSGCAAPGPSGRSWTDRTVARHMVMADSLERQMAIREALEHYGIVAEVYPRSSAYPTAVRKAALLSISDLNPAPSDSLALRWFSAYLSLPLKKPERETVRTFVTLLKRVKVLREDLNRKAITADSLSAATRRQAGILATDARRIQELESELQQANSALRKMKDIDLQLSKSRTRK